MNNNDIWTEFLSKIKNKVSLMTYNCLFKDLKLHSYKDNQVLIVIPNNELLYQNITKNYKDIIEDLLNDITNNSLEIKYIFEKDIENYKEKPAHLQKNTEENSNEMTINNDISNYNYSSNFNSKYTFDTFVVGKSNQLAYGTALAVAQNPGKLYNPYFIYAKSGLGKTHLMHAIGNYIVNHSDKKVLYISAEQFINDYVSIVNTKNKNDNNVSYLEAFREKYRNVDVLMIDDIQFLEKATKSQMEFTNTFNTLYNNEKQIIIASDRSINDYKLLEERLKTRFKWGLTESINPPEIDLKKNIIINKIMINDFDLNLDNEIIDYIANNCGSDIRNLENSVLRLVAYKATFNIEQITLEIAQEALEEYTEKVIYKTNSIAKIIDVVAKYYGIETSMIKGKMRKKNIADARAIAMYLSCIMTEESLERIGLEMGGKNHATIIYSRDKITEELRTNSKLQEEIKVLREKICE
mgnify:CR=1 FL=1